MKNRIQELLNSKELQNKKMKIIVGNYSINIETSKNNYDILIETWSNSQQKKLSFKSIDELNENFLFTSFEKELIKYKNKVIELEKFNITTNDFLNYQFKDKNIIIDFYENNYNIEDVMNDIIEIINIINNNEKEKLIDYEKTFKKIIETKKIDIYDFYSIIKNEKSLFVKNIFNFKDEINKNRLERFYLNKDEIIDNIEKLELNNNINILLQKNKIIINLKDSDIVKNYFFKDKITNDFLNKTVEIFKDILKNDKKLQTYLDFFQKNKFPVGSYIAKSYGFGIPHFYNSSFKEDVKQIQELLNNQDIKFSNEFSEAEWIYRTKLSIKSIEKGLNKDNSKQQLSL